MTEKLEESYAGFENIGSFFDPVYFVSGDPSSDCEMNSLWNYISAEEHPDPITWNIFFHRDVFF